TFNEVRLRLIDGIVDKRPVLLQVDGREGSRQVSLETRGLPDGELERDFGRTLGLELRAGAVLVGNLVGGSAAEAAGLLPNDEIVSVEGRPIRRARDLIDEVRANPDRPLAFVVRRDGAEIALSVTPRGETESAADGGGRVGKIG